MKVLAHRSMERFGDGNWQEAPLCPTPSGKYPSKTGMVKAYQSLGVAQGHVGAKITGHATRVDGAIRMAMAGIDLWRIQIFGRWGSAAVLKYVRDAPVGAHAGIAQITARALDIESLHYETSREAMDGHTQEQATVMLKGVLEAWQGKMDVQQADLHEEVANLRKLIGDMKAGEAPDAVAVPEQFVQNRRGQVVHLVRSSTHTYCGWPYALSSEAMLREAADQSDAMCQTCMRSSGLLL
jgi:hypothetical protein